MSRGARTTTDGLGYIPLADSALGFGVCDNRAMATPERSLRWDARSYDRYADERARPFHDLLARVDASRPNVVVDLGCGTGSGLLNMAHRWPDARLIGVDSSVDMLAAAATALSGFPDVTLIHADARTWSPDSDVDVLVSNALLQWIPDHTDLLPAMAGWLGPEGWLAVQVPGNFDAPSHVLLRRLADSPHGLANSVAACEGLIPSWMRRDTSGYWCRPACPSTPGRRRTCTC